MIAAIVLLWWSGGRAVQAIVGLKDAASRGVEAEPSGPSAANEGKHIHVTGEATAQWPIQDADVGLAFAGQVGVSRTAEMFQWKETKKEECQDNFGGGTTTKTTYDYAARMVRRCDELFGIKHPENHQNPEMPFRNKRFAASDAQLGSWTLESATLDRVNYAEGADARCAGRLDAQRREYLSRRPDHAQGRRYARALCRPALGHHDLAAGQAERQQLRL